MKQHIAKEQFDELTQEQKEHVYDILYKDAGPQMGVDIFGNDYMRIDIGWMIEFLERHYSRDFSITRSDTWDVHTKSIGIKGYIAANVRGKFKKELCDSLWEGVKELLEK